MENLILLADTMQHATALLADEDVEEVKKQSPPTFLNIVAAGHIPTGENGATRVPITVEMQCDESGNRKGLGIQVEGGRIQSVSATPPLKLVDLPRWLTLALGIILGLVCCSMLPSSHGEMLLDEFHTHTAGFYNPTLEPTASEEILLRSVVEGDSNPIVPDEPIILTYHKGPIMTGNNDMIRLNVIFYGSFSDKQKNILRTFFKSFWNNAVEVKASSPTVAKWWQITRRYTDSRKAPVARSIVPGGEYHDVNYSVGKSLVAAQIQNVVKRAMKQKDIGSDARDMFLVLTADDVNIERFCSSACGNHFYLSLSSSQGENGKQIPYAWVGNPGKQCPSFCAWPYAPGGFIKKALIPPNGDVGIDGMIITIGNILAGMATNPFGNGWYQDGSRLEGPGVCQGIYGTGSFSGYPGQLLVDKTTKASYNVIGASNYKFLLPWIWHPTTQQCAGQG
ncbi:hypothetical protein R1flu_015677 [Riccia fluitans]|uniref:Uncharacterized protein n=1 Tax=Riccia fluitans TaxID=41844 RepID=A0ABD1YJM6_9MARC